MRIAAQNAIASCFDKYLFAGRKVLPKIVECLKKNPETSHEKFKVREKACKCVLYSNLSALVVR